MVRLKHLAILGCTGSVGQSALAVVDQHTDKLGIVGLAAGSNVDRFSSQIAKYEPAVVSLGSRDALVELKRKGLPESIVAGCGDEGLIDVVTHPSVDLVLCASSGVTALSAVLAAIQAGKTIALANKEVLVMAGGLVMDLARRHSVSIIPVDSEHNAIHQCIDNRLPEEISQVTLTASGGPFREWTAERLETVTPMDALRHPTWSMGPKITVDSATLMNKGLEVIEAQWLFDMPPNKIDVVIHPQSVVHSLVELRDGSVIAQLGVTDMKLPIQYAFSYPDRWETTLPSLSLTQCGTLTFHEPNYERFPCLRLAYQALRSGFGYPVVLNAANEVAVEAFLSERLPFRAIPAVIEDTLDAAVSNFVKSVDSLEEIRKLDDWARAYAATALSGIKSQ